MLKLTNSNVNNNKKHEIKIKFRARIYYKIDSSALRRAQTEAERRFYGINKDKSRYCNTIHKIR